MHTHYKSGTIALITIIRIERKDPLKVYTLQCMNNSLFALPRWFIINDEEGIEK